MNIKESAGRIRTMFIRHLYLHRRSVVRNFEIFFWPVMELFMWGFLAVYLESVSASAAVRIGLSLLLAMIFWNVLYRGQLGISTAFAEDIWMHNVVNLLVSPLKLWEWLAAVFLYGFLKTFFITLLLLALTFVLYHYNLVGAAGFYFVPLAFQVLLFSLVLGIMTSALVIRWGHAAEALIWGIPFLIQPLSAIFYPLSVMPRWLTWISLSLPSTYVFEGMRSVIGAQGLKPGYFFIPLLLNLVYLAGAVFLFKRTIEQARQSGRLTRLGLE